MTYPRPTTDLRPTYDRPTTDLRPTYSEIVPIYDEKKAVGAPVIQAAQVPTAGNSALDSTTKAVT